MSSFKRPPFSIDICSSSLVYIMSKRIAPERFALARSGKCWLLCPIVFDEYIIANKATKIALLSSVIIPFV